jgi:hypothetical protein
MSNFLGWFFHVFRGKKNKFFLKNIVASALKSYIKRSWIWFFFRPRKHKKLFFLGLLLRFSNLNVLHKGLLMQDWVFRLGFDKNWSPRDLCIMILYLSHSSSSLLYWVNTEDTLPSVFWWVTGYSNPAGLFNSKLQPSNSQPQTFQPSLLNPGSWLKSLGLRSARLKSSDSNRFWSICRRHNWKCF